MSVTVQVRLRGASRTVFWELAGNVTEAELLNVIEGFGREFQDAACDRVIDATRANLSLITGEAVRRLATRARKTASGRVALVGESDAVFGMLRMFELYLDGTVDSCAFRSRSLALEWLAESAPEIDNTVAA